MQDWYTRIETLKSNIENARKRWVVPNLEESQKKTYDEKQCETCRCFRISVIT